MVASAGGGGIMTEDFASEGGERGEREKKTVD
jgi:hypothetical protein